MVLTYDDASGARVVQALDFVSADPAYAGTMTMSWEVTAVDAGTRVEIHADAVSAEDRATGLASSLANLAAS